jgi:hypothetical protein
MNLRLHLAFSLALGSVPPLRAWREPPLLLEGMKCIKMQQFRNE